MQRTTAVSVGLLFALSVVLVLVMGRGSSRPTKTAAQSSASARVIVASAAPPVEVAAAPPVDAGVLDTTVTGENTFDTLPDGRKVPELPTSAPKSVSFGVVLVTYQGAQSAPRDARSKADAEKRARLLLEEAKRDFAAAVSKGDRGSGSNLGRMQRGILEPALEYILFTLEKGSIYPEPIDTPRGYWIVRRND